MALTEKQKVFVAEYLVDLNATQAAIRAGYSAKTAAFIGAENLRKPQIQVAVQDAQLERARATQITAEKVLKELAAVAFADAGDYATVEGDGDGQRVTVTPTKDLTKSQRAAIAGVRQARDGSIEVKLADKLRALELIGRHLGMYTDKTEISGGTDSTVTLRFEDMPDGGDLMG